MNFNLNEFKTLNVNSESCFMTVTMNSVIFSSTLVEKFGKPEYVKVLVNEQERTIVLVKCSYDSPDSVEFYRPDLSSGVRWNNRGLAKKLKAIAGLPEACTLKVYSEYCKEYDVLGFDLTEARVLVGVKS